MKKFIIISLLTALSLPALACAWGEPENPYLFSMYDWNNFKDRVQTICNNNWKAYLGSTDHYYWFDADEAIKIAQQKGDALMVSYLQNLQKYLKCVQVEQDKQYEWNYPSKQDIANQQRHLLAVRTYAQSKLRTKLRSQHALLYMRSNMMLGRHQENINFWEQTASQYIETVYKDMMKNIYAGALYKKGRETEAGQMFAEMEDYESLMTIYYKKRSFQAISHHYNQNPNSKVLPFLLQDFVNNAQEAEDGKTEGIPGGKLFIRNINQHESLQMQQFCDQVLREGKTETPLMWQCAKAWLEFLIGKKQAAAKDIETAMTLAGTDHMKNSARVLKLYITTATAKPSEQFDNYLAEELTWLNASAAESEYYRRALTRITNQTIVPHYQNKPNQLLALLLATHNWGYEQRIDTMRVDRLEAFYSYTTTTDGSQFDKYLKSHIQVNDSNLIELIGTKYMRIAQWDKAIEWLKHIPASYYNHNRGREYLYYSSKRSYEVEPWLKRQWLDSSQAWEHPQTWTRNIKLEFCKEMQMLEGSLTLLQGKTLEQRCYDLATRYAQASIKGDCWWLLRTSKSCYDSIRVNETDFGAKAIQLLQQAVATKDHTLKLKALFAMGYQELYTTTSKGQLWTTTEYSEQTSDFVRLYHRQSPQFLAFQRLFSLVDNTPNEPTYISRCDEFAQFRKYYRQHK